MIKIKRAYKPPTRDDGFRVLIDQLWPRGLTKDHAAIDQWMREVAPSKDLRKWFSHDPLKWEEFRRRYIDELKGKKDLLEEIEHLEKEKKIMTLVYAAKDEKHNNAVVLQEVLSKK